MSIFRIMPDTGITFDNISPALFAELRSVDVLDGELVLVCDEGSQARVAAALMGQFNTLQPTKILSFQNDGVGLAMTIISDPLVLAATVGADEAQRPANTVFGVDQLTEDQHDEQFPERDDDTYDYGEFIDSQAEADLACKEEDGPLLLAKCMFNQLSNNSSIILQRVSDLNKLMMKTVILRNEIDILMKPVKANEKIANILDQIKVINAESAVAGSWIESVYINTDGYVIVATKPLVTENLGDGTTRKIGRIQIKFNSCIILAESSSLVASANNPIIIKNLDGFVQNDEGNWNCGHSRYNGDTCFGNVFPQIHQALLDKNLAMAIELIVRYLRNPEINDAWGKYILGFPVGGS